MTIQLIRESFRAPLLTALLVAAGTTIGAFWMQDLRRDVFPDLSAPVFNVITQNPAMGAEELETAVAIPLEAALAGLPDIRRVRSNSQLGVTQVTIEFDPAADYYRSRQFVAERVGQKGEEWMEMKDNWVEGARDYVREHPIAALGIAAAAGYLFSVISRWR